MYTLFIDTHYKDILLCLYKDNNLISKLYLKDIKSTSELLMPSIISLLNENGIDIHNINKIAVIKGPGSFTSIRLGITVAKVLAYALNIPIVSLTSIDLLGINLSEPSYISVEENNGYFISYYENDKSDIKYMKKNEYDSFIKNNKVIDNIEINYHKLINYINKLENEDCYNLNPIYIKDIGV